MSAFTNNDRLEEWLTVINDRISMLDRRWWQALILTIMVSLPMFFLLRCIEF